MKENVNYKKPDRIGKTMEEPAPAERICKAIVSNCIALNIRAQKSTESKVVAVLDAGQRLFVDINYPLDYDVPEWVLVHNWNGVEGYAKAEFLTFVEEW